ncbi:MAG: divalent metal cation transporter [Myxococcota bacterium]
MEVADQEKRRGFVAALGPGLLFAAAAVGVSHLVQSTRAGATTGLGLVGVVLAANAIKYPAFRFGPQYAAATGASLLDGYRRQGRAALWLYGALTLATMFTVQAAVTVVTAGLAIVTLGLPAAPLSVSAGILGVCAVLLARGGFALLDRLTKALVAVLTLTTLVATAAVLPRVPWATFALLPSLDGATAPFVVALFGWMPSAVDVSVWQSLWTLARRDDSGHAPSVRDAMFDFHLGYGGTVVLALCFTLMGAGVMFGTGARPADSAAGFAAQILALYTTTLGDWVAPVVGTAALAVMFSTTLTVLDGFPRALAALFASRREDGPAFSRRDYALGMGVLGVGALGVIALFLASLKTMVDVATTLSFLTAPALSTLNHRAVTADHVPAAGRPSRRLRAFSVATIGLQAAFAVGYLWFRFGRG